MFASYALVRLRFKLKKQFELFIYSLQMFPSIVFIVPFFILYIFIKKIFYIPMQNTYHGLIICYTSFALPFSIMMLKNFVTSIPRELDEQAQIDGCTRSQIIFRIIFPLSLPGILAVSLYSFIVSWNEILFAYSLTNKETTTIAVGLLLNSFIRSYEDFQNWNAACILVTLIVSIFFAFLQKQLVSGLKGSIKA